MLIAISVIIPAVAQGGFGVLWKWWCCAFNLMLVESAWCVLWDSAKYLCLLHHTKLPLLSPTPPDFNSSLFYIFQPFHSIIVSRERTWGGVEMLHSFASPRFFGVMKNDFVLYNLRCRFGFFLYTNLFTIFPYMQKQMRELMNFPRTL